MRHHAEIRRLLREMKTELQRLGIWSALPPPSEAFASTQPFCYDTMAFEQWLQWVFIPRIHALLDKDGELPLRSQIAPLAAMRFAEMTDRPTGSLLALLEEFDRLASGHLE